MRVRTDSWHNAGRKRAVLLGAVPNPLNDPDRSWSPDWRRFMVAPGNEAVPGDCWVVRQNPDDGTERGWGASTLGWPVVGYGLVCPLESCTEGVHVWDHASDCPGRFGSEPCKYDNGQAGCWTWTGTPEDDTLTGSPSLHCMAERGGCGWHGWLRNGQMVV